MEKDAKNVTERTSVPSVRSDTNLIVASAKVILPKNTIVIRVNL